MAIEPKAYSYIRISSKRQLDGFGIARQTEKAQEYADANGLILDTELQDVGSGFHGKHVKFGALGGFLKLVEEGKIADGSTLIVESLDRLSREDVLIAQGQFIDLLVAGITIVTLIDKQTYHKSRDYTQLIMSLSIMKRANDESVTKQERSQDNIRRNKLEALNGLGRFNLSCRRWIDQNKVAGSRKDYTFALNNHADTIRHIYELYDSGVGVHTIARMLNDVRTPVLKDGASKTKRWKDAIITRILLDEAVIGTYVVEENIDGKMVPMGEPIRNYYPAAVDEELFWRVQRRRDQIAYKGSTGRKFTNLFARMTRCTHCDSPLKITQAGGGMKTKLYMCNGRFVQGRSICDTNPASFRYDSLEKAILDRAEDLMLDADLGRNKAIRLEELTRMIDETEAEIADRSKVRANYVAAVGSADDAEDRAVFQNMASEARRLIEAAKSRLAAYKKNLREAAEDNVELAGVARMIAEQRALWESSKDNDEIKVSRARVSLALRKFISLIDVNFIMQTASVYVGGYSRIYQFNRYGELITTMEGSGMAFSQIEQVMRADKVSPDEIAQAKKTHAELTAD